MINIFRYTFILKFAWIIGIGLIPYAKIHAQDVPGCGSLANAYGPFDYTNAADFTNKLPIVETHHFEPEIERLQNDPRTGMLPGVDLDYTLRAFPNHHRALNSMAQYEIKTKQSPPPKSRYTADCWFKRAIYFSPKDGVVRMLYGNFLQIKKDYPAAKEEYQRAIELSGNNPTLNYNFGLLYFDMKDYEAAYEQAVLAYSAGFPLPGLKKKLKSAGYWKEY